MKRYRFVAGFAVMLIAIVSLVGSVAAASLGIPDSGEQAKSSTQAKIQNAMSAAPRSISADATILDWTMTAGKFDVLRQGNDKWSCFPDWEGSPGDDPACYDANWMIWNYALVAGTTPELLGPGIAYMLNGCINPSNTLPGIPEPLPGDPWIVDGPHIMLIEPSKPGGPKGGLDSNYFSTDWRSGQPFIMLADTDYAHLHIPTTDQKR